MVWLDTTGHAHSVPHHGHDFVIGSGHVDMANHSVHTTHATNASLIHHDITQGGCVHHGPVYHESHAVSHQTSDTYYSHNMQNHQHSHQISHQSPLNSSHHGFDHAQSNSHAGSHAISHQTITGNHHSGPNHSHQSIQHQPSYDHMLAAKSSGHKTTVDVTVNGNINCDGGHCSGGASGGIVIHF